LSREFRATALSSCLYVESNIERSRVIYVGNDEPKAKFHHCPTPLPQFIPWVVFWCGKLVEIVIKLMNVPHGPRFYPYWLGHDARLDEIIEQ
jgi:hypothetical protein